MNKIKLFNTLSWIFIIIGIILLIWRIFGNSPIVDGVLISLASGLFFKVMTIGERLTKLEVQFENHIKHK
jgi:hypothetical protein